MVLLANPVATRYAFFFFNDTATTEIYTLSLHDALPICGRAGFQPARGDRDPARERHQAAAHDRSEEHTSELQSQSNLVCRLLLEKKKKTTSLYYHLYINVKFIRLSRHPGTIHP